MQLALKQKVEVGLHRFIGDFCKSIHLSENPPHPWPSSVALQFRMWRTKEEKFCSWKQANRVHEFLFHLHAFYLWNFDRWSIANTCDSDCQHRRCQCANGCVDCCEDGFATKTQWVIEFSIVETMGICECCWDCAGLVYELRFVVVVAVECVLSHLMHHITSIVCALQVNVVLHPLNVALTVRNEWRTISGGVRIDIKYTYSQWLCMSCTYMRVYCFGCNEWNANGNATVLTAAPAMASSKRLEENTGETNCSERFRCRCC